MLGFFILFAITEYMFGEEELDEYQATREELFDDIYDKNTIIQTIIKESEHKKLSREDVNDIMDPHKFMV